MRLAVCELEALTHGRLSYKEILAGGPRWLSGELCATEPARERLRSWFERNPQPWPEPDTGKIYASLHFFGDKKMCEQFTNLLAYLPPPVIEYAIEKVTFVAVGLRLCGWCGARPSFGERRFFVVLGGYDDTAKQFNTMMHELAHTWLMPEPAEGQVAADVIQNDALINLPLEKVAEINPEARAEVVRCREASANNERQAGALTFEWWDLFKEKRKQEKENEDRHFNPE